MAVPFLLFLLLQVAAGAPYSLGIASDGPCNGLSTWAAGDCQITAGENIPAFTVGLFDHTGSPCCGETRVSVQVAVSKLSAAVAVSGFTDRDSVQGDPSMQVEFSGLRIPGTEAGSNFTLTFTTFYNGYFLTYVSPNFKVLPNSIELEAPWGSWGDYVPPDTDNGPWMVHEVLPTFRVALAVLNTTATSIVAEDGFYIGARLFDKNSLADISQTSLVGTTRHLVSDGIVNFEGLSVRYVAGTGFRMSFFLEGSDVPCLPENLRVVCDEREEMRGLTGGLGGYLTETMTQDIVIYPDIMSLEIFGKHPPFLRVDETMFSYRVQFFDSMQPSVAISGFVPSDAFTVAASLFNGDNTDISSWGLDGTKIAAPAGDSATFVDLVVRGTAGSSFALKFSANWNQRCVAKLIDTACSGKCCVQTSRFSVFPFSIQPNPMSLPGTTEGSTLPNITVSFYDYSMNLLSGIVPADGFAVTPFLRKRGRIIAFDGERTLVVNRGVVEFSNLQILEEAGSFFTLLFEEDNSRISSITKQFHVYDSSLELENSAQPNIAAGMDLQTVTVLLRGEQNQTLTAIEAADNFTVTVHAMKYDGSSWLDCGCIAGPRTGVADSGVVSFDGSSMTIRSTIGFFRLELRQQRVDMTTLKARTNAFSVLPFALTIVETSPQRSYSAGEAIHS